MRRARSDLVSVGTEAIVAGPGVIGRNLPHPLAGLSGCQIVARVAARTFRAGRG